MIGNISSRKRLPTSAAQATFPSLRKMTSSHVLGVLDLTFLDIKEESGKQRYGKAKLSSWLVLC